MRRLTRLLCGALLVGVVSTAYPWSQHALGTWQALNAMPEVRAEPPVKVESLEHFLLEQGAEIDALLMHEEQWARGHVSNYPARPEVLAYHFDEQADGAELRRRFLAALRVNPKIPLPLFLQLQPVPTVQAANQRPVLSWHDVTLVKSDPAMVNQKFVALREGEQVPVLELLATASDEPDYGMDIGLWDDNGTDYGRTYGFGKQPFGNPKLEFGSQAPFHMGFFHESPVIYAAAGFLRRTYPDYRMHLWQSLAQQALVTGHPYWGWRFAGWAMHYAQDLTQPYHACVLPGVSTAEMLWINALDIGGYARSKQRAITLVSNRHLALENYHQHSLLAPLQKGEMDHPNLKAFTNISKDAGRMALHETGLREVVSRQAYDAAGEIDALVLATFPARYVNDPDIELGAGLYHIDFYSLLQQQKPPTLDVFDQRLRDLSTNFGSVTRAVWRRLQ